jgi:hypothetical protein
LRDLAIAQAVGNQGDHLFFTGSEQSNAAGVHHVANG